MSDDGNFRELQEGDPDVGPDAGCRSGVVLKWRRRGDMFEGLVSREVNGRVVTAWIPAMRMSPALPREPASGGEGRPPAERKP